MLHVRFLALLSLFGTPLPLGLKDVAAIFCKICLEDIWIYRRNRLPASFAACQLHFLLCQRLHHSMFLNHSYEIRLGSKGSVGRAEHTLLQWALWAPPD